VLPYDERGDYLACVRERIKTQLCDVDGRWTADYVRLRFAAHLRESARNRAADVGCGVLKLKPR